jgi:CHAT domain-containing protein
VYGQGDERLAGRGAGDVKAQPYPRLRHSASELRHIADVLGRDAPDVHLGFEATEARIKQASKERRLASARYVHFATHGILESDQVRSPSLVCSLVGNQGEDGFLQLEEALRLELNADLVVLSACESGRGRLYQGEGVHGLPRAFLHAGSRAVVCSLWKVEDESTAEFMTAFYRELRQGRTAADALQAAKKQMLADGYPPLSWAPFVLIGE